MKHIDTIINTVCFAFEVNKEQVLGNCKKRPVADARAATATIMCCLGMSHGQIVKVLPYKYSSSVSNTIKKSNDLLCTDEAYRQKTQTAKAILNII